MAIIKSFCIFAPPNRRETSRAMYKSICIGPLIEIRQILNTRTIVLMSFAFAFMSGPNRPTHTGRHRIRFKVSFTCGRRLAMPN